MGFATDYKNFIFDFDMTLVDTSMGSALCYEKSLNAAGEIFDKANLSLYMSEFLDATYNRISRPKISYKEFEETFYFYSHSIMAKQSKLFPETRGVVLSLAKTNHLAIVTNKDRTCVDKILQYHNLPEDLFDIIICCDDVSNRKPHPEALITCMDKLYWQKQDCLYIGDNSTDLRFAANAGIDAVIVTRSKCQSEYEIETLNALLN